MTRKQSAVLLKSILSKSKSVRYDGSCNQR